LGDRGRERERERERQRQRERESLSVFERETVNGGKPNVGKIIQGKAIK
jgi:hypothetical protein